VKLPYLNCQAVVQMLSLIALHLQEVDVDVIGLEAEVMKKKDLEDGDVTEVVEVVYGVP
jgi:hypothetical protein